MTDDKPLILLIEDEPQMRRFLRVTLQSQGYRLIEAETGKDGLIQVASRKPAVILPGSRSATRFGRSMLEPTTT